MESRVFDIIKLDKDKAIARFNCFRRIANLRQFLEVFVVLGLISWSSARAPQLFRTAAAYAVEFSTHLFNHHVVFLIGNAIIVLLFLLCRQNDAVACGGSDLYNDYVKHSEAATTAAAAVVDQSEPADLPPPSSPTPTAGGGGEEEVEEKQIVVCSEEITIAVETRQCDDVAAAIEKATREIKKFQRTQSEKLKREIRATPLRRSESENRRNSVSCGERFDAAEMERLSSEEFRRTVDAFIDERWCRRKTKQNRFDKYELLKMAA